MIASMLLMAGLGGRRARAAGEDAGAPHDFVLGQFRLRPPRRLDALTSPAFDRGNGLSPISPDGREKV